VTISYGRTTSHEEDRIAVQRHTGQRGPKGFRQTAETERIRIRGRTDSLPFQFSFPSFLKFVENSMLA
jgi:hypothetical protein